MADVDIVLPDGGGATVPEGDLSRAIAAGAKVAQAGPAVGSDEEFVNSGLGQGLTAILAAGRSASLGATDVLATSGAGLLGGRGAEKAVAKAFSTAKEANPYADLAGETAGIFLGGGGLTADHWSAAGYGETDPIMGNDSSENMQKNRRVELVVLPNVEEMLDLKSLTK